MAANNEELISSFIDMPAIEKESTWFKNELLSIHDLYQKLNTSRITLQGAQSTSGTYNGAKQMKADLDALTAASDKFIKSQSQQAKVAADQSSAAINVSTSLKKEAGGYEKLIGLLTKNQIAQKALTDEKKKLDDAFKTGKIQVDKYTESLSEINKSQLILKTQNSDIALSLKNLEKGFQSADGSLNQLRAELNLSLQAFDRLSEAEKKESTGQELQTKIQNLTKTISEQEQATGRFQRNVGNYANAFASALTPIQTALKDIQNNINSGNFTGEGLATLQKQEQALVQITEQLNQEFANTKQQSRAFQEAAAQIGTVFGQNTEIFQNFRDQVGEGVDSLNDIRDSIKLASSDTRQLDLLVGAAQGIAGGFAIAQGAASLFGNDSEELQKTLVKLNGVMTILNGLQAIQNELKNKDSIIRKVVNFLTAQETKLIQAKAVAQSTDAVATEAGAVATRAFGTALKGIGIGILLTLIPLIVSAANSISRLKKSSDDAKLSMEDLQEINKKAADSFADQAVKLEQLKEQFEASNASFRTKKEVTAELNKEFGDYGVHLKNVTEAEKFLVEKAPLFIQMLDLKAKAAAALSLATDEYKKVLEVQNRSVEESGNFIDRFVNKLGAGGIIGLTALREAGQKNKEELDKAQANYDKFLHASNDFEAQAKAIADRIGLKTTPTPTVDNKALEDNLNKIKAQFQALAEFNDALQDQTLEKLTKISDDENALTGLRIIALKKYSELKAQQLRSDAENEIAINHSTAAEALVIRQKAANDISKLEQDTAIKIAGLRVKNEKATNDKVLQQQEDFENKMIAFGDQASEKLKANREKQLADEKEYNDKRLELEKEFQENKGELASKEFELENQLLQTAATFIDSGFEKNKNALQEQIDALDAQRDKEIEVANQTIQNERDKAAAIVAINARADAQKQVLEKKQKQEDVKKARFDKAVQVAQIIGTVAQGEIALTVKAAEARAEAALLASNPLTAALAPIALASAGLIVAQEVVLAAIGAAQIAAVLATPIPTYAQGTKDHPGGLAILGDAGKKEIALTPDGKAHITPDKATLINLPKHTTVFPDADEFMRVSYSMTMPKLRILDRFRDNETSTARLEKELREIKATIANKREAHFHVTPYGLLAQQRDLNSQIDYLNDNLHF